MEDKIFTWKSWDMPEAGRMSFTNCKLIADVGDYKTGWDIPNIIIDFAAGKMVFCNDQGGIESQFKLTLNVVPDEQYEIDTP